MCSRRISNMVLRVDTLLKSKRNESRSFTNWVERFSAKRKRMNIENNHEYISVIFEQLAESENTLVAIEFENCTFKNCNFSEAVFQKCKFLECTFTQCNLSNVNLAYSKFSDVTFDQSKLIGINWTKADWPRLNFFTSLKFNECIMNDASFFGLSLNELVLENCKAHDVDFRNGSFNDAKFRNTDFTDSLFAKSNLKGADFQDAINYDINIFENDISRAIFSRDEAVRLLINSVDIELVD